MTESVPNRVGIGREKAALECPTPALMLETERCREAELLKILQARLQQYVNRELPEVQAGFKKAEEPEIKLPTSAGSSKKQEFQKNIYFCFIDYAKQSL